MAVVTRETCKELDQIAQALREGQISRAQAEYLSKERFELGMMRFRLLITLHEILKNEIDEYVDQQDQPQSSDATVDSPGDLAGEKPCTAASLRIVTFAKQARQLALEDCSYAFGKNQKTRFCPAGNCKKAFVDDRFPCPQPHAIPVCAGVDPTHT